MGKIDESPVELPNVGAAEKSKTFTSHTNVRSIDPGNVSATFDEDETADNIDDKAGDWEDLRDAADVHGNGGGRNYQLKSCGLTRDDEPRDNRLDDALAICCAVACLVIYVVHCTVHRSVSHTVHYSAHYAVNSTVHCAKYCMLSPLCRSSSSLFCSPFVDLKSFNLNI